MIEERGRVVASSGDQVLIETQRRAGCGSCGTSGGCGVATLAGWLGRRPTRVQATDPLGTCVGDEVVVGIQERSLLQAAALAYLFPLAGMFLLALVAVAAGLPEPVVVAAGVAGLVSGVAAGRYIARQVTRHGLLQPRILRRSMD